MYVFSAGALPRSGPLAALATALLLVLVLAPSRAVTAQERPPDSSAVQAPAQDTLTVIYQAALTLRAAGERELADDLFDYITRRWPDSAEAEAIRALWSREGNLGAAGDGRTELVVWSTLYGLWLGIAVPGMLGASDAKAFGAGLLVGGPLGYLISSQATLNAPIGDGHAEAITWGGTWGTWQGFGWAHVLDLGSECTTIDGRTYCHGTSPRAVYQSMVGGGVVGGITGAILGRTRSIPAGRSTMASLGSLWGTWIGFAIAGILEVEDGDRVLAHGMVGGNLGLLAGALARPGNPLSRNRARIASVIGVAAGLAGVGLVLMIQPESIQAAIGIPLAGSVVGLLAGIGATPDDPSRREVGVRPHSGPQGSVWKVGGPVTPTVVGVRAERRPALNVTLLSARF